MSAAIKCFAALWVIGAIGRIITPIGLLYTSECVCVCACYFCYFLVLVEC